MIEAHDQDGKGARDAWGMRNALDVRLGFEKIGRGILDAQEIG